MTTIKCYKIMMHKMQTRMKKEAVNLKNNNKLKNKLSMVVVLNDDIYVNLVHFIILLKAASIELNYILY